MGLFNLDRIFDPRNIAVIGASGTEKSIGNALMKNLVEGGFEGNVVPINPRYSELYGLRVYPLLSDAPERVDLAVIATPIFTVPAIIGECVRLGVAGAIIISAGGKESGEKGREIEAQIEEVAAGTGLRIIGPNCLGILRPGKRVNASFAHQMVQDGTLAFISQSGAICTAMLDLALKENMGFRYFVSIGSMLDVDFGDLIDYLGNDPDVKCILLYVESLSNFRKFMSAAREVSRVKPIIVLKSGRSAAGAQAAASHTGAMAGEDAVYDAAFKRAGIVRVDDLEGFFDCAELLAKQRPPAGPRIVVVTNAGGPGVMAADAVAQHGLELSVLSEETMNRLNRILPPHWSHRNPIDLLGDATAERYAAVSDCCFLDGEIDGMLVILNPQAMTEPAEVAEAVAKSIKNRPFPVFAVWMGGGHVEEGIRILNRENIPTYATPERAVRSFKYLYAYSRNLEMLQEIPSSLPQAETNEAAARNIIDEALKSPNGLLTEKESKLLLASYGVTVNHTEVALTLYDALRVAAQMGYPLVMKIHSRDITHKTEAGGVKVGLDNQKEVRAGFHEIMRNARNYDPSAVLEGVSLQRMISKPEVELLLGAKRDPHFGPVILFGLGGIFAEVLGDRSLGLPPMNQTLARRIMEESRAFRILKGYRNRPPADLELLERMIISLSHLLVDFPEIIELDMNPVIVKDGKPCAVDARVIVRSSEVRPPHHLVISPYPQQYEFHEITSSGLSLLLRPIRPEDAPLLLELFDSMSMRSRYLRFFNPIRSLSPDLVVRFTQVDYDRHIALVAVRKENGKESILGVARIISDPDRKSAEFSVAVGDQWQRKGIGKTLMECILRVARDYGIKRIHGEVLAENAEMLELGHILGFTRSSEGKAGDYILTLELTESPGITKRMTE
ncbi:MAG: GNAT family N-acetyltransferase [Desulfobacterales bacterium]|nr:GNAT family N-acetyltransferase [Desulfobacterales bacterium]